MRVTKQPDISLQRLCRLLNGLFTRVNCTDWSRVEHLELLQSELSEVQQQAVRAQAALAQEIAARRGPQAKEYKVAAVSSNTNSFGLHNIVLLARDGEAWDVGASHFTIERHGIAKGTILRCPLRPVRNTLASPRYDHDWAFFGFEIPNPRPKADVATMNAVLHDTWGAEACLDHTFAL
jgi:hypothetical protein